MKLDLNVKEWLALYGLLERQTRTDKQLFEVSNRMRAVLADLLNQRERSKFDTWFDVNQTKINDMQQQNINIKAQVNEILTDDDNEQPATPVAYPKKSNKKSRRR